MAPFTFWLLVKQIAKDTAVGASWGHQAARHGPQRETFNSVSAPQHFPSLGDKDETSLEASLAQGQQQAFNNIPRLFTSSLKS